jgi:hypothetical protein
VKHLSVAPLWGRLPQKPQQPFGFDLPKNEQINWLQKNKLLMPEQTHFENYKQLLDYQNNLLLGDIKWSKFKSEQHIFKL